MAASTDKTLQTISQIDIQIREMYDDLEALNVGVYIADCVSDSKRYSFKFFVD